MMTMTVRRRRLRARTLASGPSTSPLRSRPSQLALPKSQTAPSLLQSPLLTAQEKAAISPRHQLSPLKPRVLRSGPSCAPEGCSACPPGCPIWSSIPHSTPPPPPVPACDGEHCKIGPPPPATLACPSGGCFHPHPTIIVSEGTRYQSGVLIAVAAFVMAVGWL